jgi:hypothetical protein
VDAPATTTKTKPQGATLQGVTDTLERVYHAMLVVGPVSFLVVAAVFAVQGDLLQAGGLLAIAAIVGTMSVYFYRGGG